MAANMASLSLLRRLYLMLLVCVAFHPVLSTIRGINDIGQARLLKAIMFEGRVAVQPKISDQPTIVTLSLRLIAVQDLNIAKQVLSVNGIFTVNWNDPFLRWNVSDYDNIRKTHLPATSIWTPPFDITNSINQRQLEATWQNDKVIVTFDGGVWWYATGSLNVACKANAFYFPFDTQKCYINVYQRDTIEDDYILTGLKFGGKFVLGVENWEWTVIDHEVINDRLPSDVVGSYITGVRISYTLKRQPTSHFLTIIAPVVLLFFVGLMVFPLPADSGEKISLGVACLMSFFIIQLMISQEIPKSWKSVPVIMIFNFGFMLLNALSICVTVLVLNLHHRQQSDVPKCLQRFLKQKGLLKSNNVVHDSESKIQPVDHNDKLKSENTFEGEGSSTNAILSAILKEIQNRRDDLKKKQCENDELNLQKWKDLADVVNKILCVIYVFFAVIVGMVCLGFWSQG